MNGIHEVTGSIPVRSTVDKGQSARLSFFLAEMMPTPIKIKKTPAGDLSILWSDGHDGLVSLGVLRDRCPCAGCQGETILLKSYKPVMPPDMPGKYELRGIQQVGSYALQVSWGDGHATGLYTWEKLRSLCECETCKSR